MTDKRPFVSFGPPPDVETTFVYGGGGKYRLVRVNGKLVWTIPEPRRRLPAFLRRLIGKS